MAKMSRQELVELIESVEEGGGDATDLKALLAEVDSDLRKRNTSGRTRRDSRFREEEETMEERLTRRVGDLFPNGIPYQEILDCDRRFLQKELVAQCRKAGISVSGDKYELAAKLIAYNSVSAEETYLGEGI